MSVNGPWKNHSKRSHSPPSFRAMTFATGLLCGRRLSPVIISRNLGIAWNGECHGGRSEIRKPFLQGQEGQPGKEGRIISITDIGRILPLAHQHTGFLSRHAFGLPDTAAIILQSYGCGVVSVFSTRIWQIPSTGKLRPPGLVSSS